MLINTRQLDVEKIQLELNTMKQRQLAKENNEQEDMNFKQLPADADMDNTKHEDNPGQLKQVALKSVSNSKIKMLS